LPQAIVVGGGKPPLLRRSHPFPAGRRRDLELFSNPGIMLQYALGGQERAAWMRRLWSAPRKERLPLKLIALDHEIGVLASNSIRQCR
jgi:hypothetical protein